MTRTVGEMLGEAFTLGVERGLKKLEDESPIYGELLTVVEELQSLVAGAVPPERNDQDDRDKR